MKRFLVFLLGLLAAALLPPVVAYAIEYLYPPRYPMSGLSQRPR